jgi:ketosteroid isomerase-like protein
MKRILAAGILVLVLAGCGKEDPVAHNVQSLVDAERGFARNAVALGMQAAFMNALADDGVVFRPYAVNGKEFYRDREDPDGVLIWAPERAEVSTAGDLGYTTGPWEFRRGGTEGEVLATGRYISVWTRGEDGVWRLAADIGTSGPAGGAMPDSVDLTGPSRRASVPSSEASLEALHALDRRISSTAYSRGTAAALEPLGAADLQIYRNDRPPALGREDALAALTALDEKIGYDPEGGGIAASGDFGYTYGRTTRAPSAPGEAGPEGSYLRIFRADSGSAHGWTVALDVAVPGD